jgi:hypothetical protein
MSIAKPEDRCPYSDGTKVTYWHWAGPGFPPKPILEGTVVTVTAEDIETCAQFFWGSIKTGDRAVKYFDPAYPNAFMLDPFMEAPVQPGEPQRWYKDGEKPGA